MTKDAISADEVATAGPLIGESDWSRRGNGAANGGRAAGGGIRRIKKGLGLDTKRGGFVAIDRGLDDLDEKERLFSRFFVQFAGDAKTAAERAGYKVPAAASAALLNRPVVLRYIRDLQESLLAGEVSTVAIATVLEVMRDRLAKPSARISAARLAAEMSGLIGPKAVAKQAQVSENPEQIVMAELAKAVKNLSVAGVLDAGRLGPIVDISPVDAPQSAPRSGDQKAEATSETAD